MAKHFYILFLLVFLLSSCSEDGAVFSPEEKKVDEITFEPFWLSYSNYVWAFEYTNPDLKYFDFYSTELYHGETGIILGYEFKIISLYKDKIFIRANKEILEKDLLPKTISIKRLF